MADDNNEHEEDIAPAERKRRRELGDRLICLLRNGQRVDGMDFSFADLQGRLFGECNLTGIKLSCANLRGATLDLCDFSDAKLDGACMEGTKLNGANLDNANLFHACLGGAWMLDIVGVPRFRQGALLDSRACAQSQWSAHQLNEWVHAGARLVDPEGLSDELRESLFREGQGLTLYFDTRLTRLDRFLVDGVVVGVLGRHTTVEVAEVRQFGCGTLVRLEGGRREDLEAVGNTLWRRIWEEGPRQQLINNNGNVEQQVNVAGNFTVVAEVQEVLARLDHLQQLGGSLSELRGHLERIELRLSEGVSEMVRHWGSDGGEE